MTVVFRENATEVVFAKPGVYPVSGDGTWGGPAGVSAAAVGILAIHMIGDFIGSSSGGREILVNNRAPLGRLQRLQAEDVIEIRQHRDIGDNPRSRLRLVYGWKAPPIQFILPTRSPIRCGYTLSPLAGEAAMRCGKCFQLYGAGAWIGDLCGNCPRCGWPDEETSP